MLDSNAPVNVRIVTSDGSEIPVDCRYVGVDMMGMHCWETVFPYCVDGVGLIADSVPENTKIDIFIRGERS